MKKISIIFSVFCIALSLNAVAENNDVKTSQKDNSAPSYSQMNDWRIGNYRRKVKENFITLDVEAIPVITKELKDATAWGGGLRVGYEHKTRPSSISSRFSIGFGGHIGVDRYFGKDIKVSAIGNHNEIAKDKFKSYTEIPAMLDFNWYYNWNRNSFAIGVSAGANFLLGQRDVALKELTDTPAVLTRLGLNPEGYIASIQQDENEVSLTHVIPTARGLLTYMHEFSQDWRFRIQAGVEYQMKYKDEYKGFYLNGSDYLELYHKGDSPASLNPFVSVGLVYSL
ncbi:MAG: hypothetical protein IJ213_03085 [Bacteroidales bacterium]|nr:hypothetical protein [Bacteroidales bacterium]MBQ9312009.1 hypothetical protein [Bacteroidales bacterium]